MPESCPPAHPRVTLAARNEASRTVPPSIATAAAIDRIVRIRQPIVIPLHIAAGPLIDPET